MGNFKLFPNVPSYLNVGQPAFPLQKSLSISLSLGLDSSHSVTSTEKVQPRKIPLVGTKSLNLSDQFTCRVFGRSIRYQKYVYDMKSVRTSSRVSCKACKAEFRYFVKVSLATFHTTAEASSVWYRCNQFSNHNKCRGFSLAIRNEVQTLVQISGKTSGGMPIIAMNDLRFKFLRNFADAIYIQEFAESMSPRRNE